MKRFKSIQPGDIIVKGDRIWRVKGVHIGALGHENLVSLEALDLRPGSVGDCPITEPAVPEDLIDHDCIFRAVDHEAARRGPAPRIASDTPASEPPFARTERLHRYLHPRPI